MLKRLLPALVLPLLLTAPAQAVIIDSGDGTGNTTAPADDPGFVHVGRRGSLTAIYVGYGWVLSAAHVGIGDVVFEGVSYPALSGSRIVLIHSGTTEADLELFRVDPAPSLPPLPIRASQPTVDDPVIMIGNGRNRGDAVSVFPPPEVDDGYYWGPGQAIRWGTNVVDSIVPDLDTGFRVTDSFATSFSRSGTADECQGANGDSGGAVFIKNAGTWELAGVMHVIGVFEEQVGDLEETSLYGNFTYAADLSQYRTQILDIVTPVCGNGYLTIDEECDDGNTLDGDCCSSTCEYESAATECRAAAGVCDAPDSCDGAGSCDADGKLTTVCRGSLGACDAAEVCDGVANDCPADAKLTTECRASGGVCDVAEVCDGVADDCPADTKLATECRASAGICDVAEVCDGVEDECPADVHAPPTTVCRTDAGECDVAENCDGAGGCPPDAFEPLDTPCGDSGSTACDDPDTCDGAGSCQLNYKLPTTSCRGAAGVCDAVDYCDGAGSCDADAKLTTVCRDSAGVCDAVEVCDGVSDTCRRDLPRNGLPCPDGDLCNGNEICEGFVCTPRTPPVCDDGVSCTADSCDPELGCVYEPIPGTGCLRPDLPSASPAGRLLLSLLVVGAGATLLTRRRRSKA